MANTTKKYVSLDKLSLYNEKINKVITDGDDAALASAKSYANSLAVNYDAAGSAATAEANAKSYTDGQIATVNGTIANVKTTAEQGVANAATADGKAVKAQEDVDALKTYVGTIPTGATATDIVGYVQEKTAGIATEGAMTELGNRVTAVEGDVATIKGDYLKGSDKTELEGAIEDVQGAVDAEIERATGVESGFETRIKAIEDDYLKAADKTELQNGIDAVNGAIERLTNGVSADEVDGVNDLINYVKEHGTEVTGMQEDIAENAEAISGVSGRVGTLEGKMTTVEGAVATKVEQSVYDAKVAELAGADTALGNRITALEAKHGDGEGTVESLIATAKQEAIDAAAGDATSKANAAQSAAESTAKGYTDAEIDKVESTIATLTETVGTKASQSEVNTISGKVGTLETDMAQAKTDIDAVEAKAAANESAIGTLNTTVAGKASQSDLDGVSGRVTTLETWHNNFTEVSEEEINSLFTA